MDLKQRKGFDIIYLIPMPYTRVADPHNYNDYQDYSFYFYLYCGFWYDFSLWNKSRSCSSKGRESATTGLPSLHSSILSLHASIVSVNGPLSLYFWAFTTPHFDFNGGLYPTFPYNADPDPASQKK